MKLIKNAFKKAIKRKLISGQVNQFQDYGFDHLYKAIKEN